MMDLLETSFLAEQEVSEGDTFNSRANCSHVGPVERRIWKIYALRKCCTRRKWTFKRVAKFLKCTWLKMKLLMKSSCRWSCYSSEQFSLFSSLPPPSPLSPSLLLLLFKRLPSKEHKAVSFCSEFTGQKRINSSVIVSLTQSLISLPRWWCLIKFPFLLQGEEGIPWWESLNSDSFKVFWGLLGVPAAEEGLGPQISWIWMFSFPPAPRGKGSLLGSGSREMIPGAFSLFIFFKVREEHPGRAQAAPGPAWLNSSRKRVKKSRKKEV